MTFLVVPGSPHTLLQQTDPGVAKPVGVIYDEQIAGRIRDLLNREGLVDVLLDHPRLPDEEGDTP